MVAKGFFRAVVIVLSVFLAAVDLHAELTPDQVAVVAPRWSKEAQALAKYYLEARGIPPNQLCLVDMPRGEVLSRHDWASAVRPAIHKWIVDNDPDAKLRCLVTVWDVPLKIGPAELGDLRQYRKFLHAERVKRIDLVGQAIDQLDQIAKEIVLDKGTAPDEGRNGETWKEIDEVGPAKTEGGVPADELQRLRIRLETALRGAQHRLAKQTDEQARLQGGRHVEQLATATGGIRVILQSLAIQMQSLGDKAPRQGLQQFELLRGRVSAFNEARFVIEQSAPGIQRDALAMAMLERFGGLLATLEWIDEQAKAVEKNETSASFDSELSLVMWPDDYQLLRWQPNYLHRNYANSQLGEAFRTLMVARLDAPTLELAKHLVDTPIKIEKQGGLKGKFYLDARGIGSLEQTNVTMGSYADYDRSLLITAEGVKQLFPEIEVVLDNQPTLFAPGMCPEAALYCGWYSLAKYVDAFEWQPGAVAYHIASGEASTLRNAASQVWCKRMLEEGVCATVGPVYEPYLLAFPRPNEFFSLLLQGDLTLVECYYQTQPYNSWMMTLIGDPLYRPFLK